MKTLAEIKGQYSEQVIGNMTTDEVYDYAKDLEQLVVDLESRLNIETVAYGVGRSDIRYMLSGILNLDEDYISDDLIDTVFDEIKRNFTMEEETELFSNFIRGQLDVTKLHQVYTGILSGDGSVIHIYFHDEPGMESSDAQLTGDAVERFLEHVFGEEFDAMIDTSPFTFDRSKLEDF